MDRVLRHLENISIGYLVLGMVAIVIVAILFPKKYGMEASLIGSAIWLNLNRFTNLGPIASISKATYWMPLLLLIWFAMRRPGVKNSVPRVAWIYLALPFIGCLCVSTTTDAMYGYVNFANMFLLAAAAIAVYQTIDSEETFIRIVACIFIGLMVPLFISILALVFFRGRSFIPGLGRFSPFGINANQLVPMLATVMAFGGWAIVSYKNKALRIACMAALGASTTLLMVTGSRQGVVIATVAMLPVLAWAAAKPITLIIGAVVSVAVGVWVFGFTEGAASTKRLSDFGNTSGRYETSMEYARIFADRPVAGLLGTSGQSVMLAAEVGTIPHNSYMGMLYLGGLALGAPLAFAVLATIKSAIAVVANRRLVNMRPALLWMAIALLTAIYLHGLISDMIFWSVSTWTFLNYLLSCFFLGLSRNIRKSKYHPAPQLRTAYA